MGDVRVLLVLLALGLQGCGLPVAVYYLETRDRGESPIAAVGSSSL